MHEIKTKNELGWQCLLLKSWLHCTWPYTCRKIYAQSLRKAKERKVCASPVLPSLLRHSTTKILLSAVDACNEDPFSTPVNIESWAIHNDCVLIWCMERMRQLKNNHKKSPSIASWGLLMRWEVIGLVSADAWRTHHILRVEKHALL